MRMLFHLTWIAGIAFAAYWFGLRDGCGTRGANACPDPLLEQGVGVTLSARKVCPGAGYLCAGRDSFQVVRWPLDKGRLRVRVAIPEFLNDKAARQVRAAAIEGIMVWDGQPFPLVIDSDEFTFRFWDIGVVWTRGLYNAAAGLNRNDGRIDGKRINFSVDGLTIVVPSDATPDAALLALVKAVATHEMGHALALGHSDSEDDIMFPQLRPDPRRNRASERDFRTLEALYSIPNGAMVQ